MSAILNASNNGVLGIQPRTVIVKCRNAEASTAIAKYDLVVLDVAQASIEPGLGDAAAGSASTSKFANVKVSPANRSATSSGIYGVAQEAIAAGATGSVMFAGITPCKTVSETYTQGQLVGLPSSSGTAASLVRLSVTQTIGTVVVTTSASATQATILLDGNVSYGAVST